MTKKASASLSDVFSYSNLVHAVAGAVGSSVAISAFYPLDVARTRLQVEDHRKAKYSLLVIKDIMDEEGSTGLYRGWFPVVTSICCSNFVYFYTFNGLKVLAYKGGAEPYPAKDLLLGFLAGIVNVVVTTPLWVANTRLKLQGIKWKKEEENHTGEVQNGFSIPATNYSGMLDVIWKIARSEGFFQLWSGSLPSVFLATNPAIQFMVYEALKRKLQRYFHGQEFPGLVYFLMGALAKMVATFVTYPMQIVQSKLRAGQIHHGIIRWLRDTFRSQGWLGMYKGLETKLLQTVSMTALMFLTYEKLAAFVFKLMRQQFRTKSKMV